jgi:predicted 3-demethylubiquinone-9 3-methyltransferase (glyoxalase superfamily)
MNHPDTAVSDRAMQAVMGMKKLDIAEIERAVSRPI